MTASMFLFLIAITLMAPHTSSGTATFYGVVSFVFAIIFWILEVAA